MTTTSSARFEEALDAARADARRLRDGPDAARLRRAAAARAHGASTPASELRAALDAFERLGAAPWADQAAPSSRPRARPPRRRDPSTLDELTPQELQIALLLAEGRTTREAAAALFLSPKTIEYHLRNVYRKLGIHSREELRNVVGSSRARA